MKIGIYWISNRLISCRTYLFVYFWKRFHVHWLLYYVRLSTWHLRDDALCTELSFLFFIFCNLIFRTNIILCSSLSKSRLTSLAVVIYQKNSIKHYFFCLYKKQIWCTIASSRRQLSQTRRVRFVTKILLSY